MYHTFDPQSYINSHMINNEEVALLFSLRSKTVINIKSNFSSIHNMQLQCQLGCAAEETQEHCMEYPFQTVNNSRDQNVLYAYIFGTLEQQ